MSYMFTTPSTWTPAADYTDELYRERLDAFAESTLKDIHLFAQREGRNFDQTRRDLAEWHSRWLFQYHPARSMDSAGSTGKGTRTEQVHKVLIDTSRILESLHKVSDVHSVLLAVDPLETVSSPSSPVGFLGGTSLGREFWRGMDGGGDAGARRFREHCLGTIPAKPVTTTRTLATAVSTAKRTPAGAVKADLVTEMRAALRMASGNAAAEFKWTNHARLCNYGVSLQGWPAEIPTNLNPSVMTVSQNAAVLNALRSKTLRLLPLNGQVPDVQSQTVADGSYTAENDDWQSFLVNDEDIENGDVHPRKRSRVNFDPSST